MTRKVVTSGPVHGTCCEVAVDLGPASPHLRPGNPIYSSDGPGKTPTKGGGHQVVKLLPEQFTEAALRRKQKPPWARRRRGPAA